MDKKTIETVNFEETGYSYTLSLISGKYKPVILHSRFLLRSLRQSNR